MAEEKITPNSKAMELNAVLPEVKLGGLLDRNRTIIVMGAGKVLSAELIAQIKHSHGEDMIIISEEQAKENGVIPNIENKPFIIKAMPELKMPFIDVHAEKNDCKKGWRK